MNTIFELFIKQKIVFNFVYFSSPQSLSDFFHKKEPTAGLYLPAIVASNLASELGEVDLKVPHSFSFLENLLERNCEMTCG